MRPLGLRLTRARARACVSAYVRVSTKIFCCANNASLLPHPSFVSRLSLSPRSTFLPTPGCLRWEGMVSQYGDSSAAGYAPYVASDGYAYSVYVENNAQLSDLCYVKPWTMSDMVYVCSNAATVQVRETLRTSSPGQFLCNVTELAPDDLCPCFQSPGENETPSPEEPPAHTSAPSHASLAHESGTSLTCPFPSNFIRRNRQGLTLDKGLALIQGCARRPKVEGTDR